MMQFTALMGLVEDKVADSFRKGGGVPYSEYPAFQQMMNEFSAQVTDATLIDVTLPLVPGFGREAEGGNRRGGRGLRVGPRDQPDGQSIPAIADSSAMTSRKRASRRARRRRKSMGLSNAEFEVKDAAKLDGSRQFDLITVFDAIHDQAQPARVLQGSRMR